MKVKRWLSFLAIIMALTLCTQDVLATSSTDLKNKKEEAQKELEKSKEELEGINGNIDELTGEYGAITDEIDALDMEIIDIMASISLLEEEITEKEAEIAQAKIDLEAAIERENEQYAAMKIRIQMMYESNTASFVLEADSFSDMLTRAEYVDKIYTSDREMLKEYVATKEEVAAMKGNLEIEESELVAAKGECEAEKADLETAMAELKTVAADYESKIASAKKQAASYASKIKKQNAEIKKLEAARKAAEERENQKNNPTSDGTKTGSSYTLDPSVITNATGSDSGKQVAQYAVKFLGNPYKAGGTSLTQGTDCSGFTYSVYQNFGVTIPRNSYGQRSAGTEVAYENAQPGDIVCYAGHVGMYVGGGKIVHASSEKTGIKISNATYRSIITVRRIL